MYIVVALKIHPNEGNRQLHQDQNLSCHIKPPVPRQDLLNYTSDLGTSRRKLTPEAVCTNGQTKNERVRIQHIVSVSILGTEISLSTHHD